MILSIVCRPKVFFINTDFTYVSEIPYTLSCSTNCRRVYLYRRKNIFYTPAYIFSLGHIDLRVERANSFLLSSISLVLTPTSGILSYVSLFDVPSSVGYPRLLGTPFLYRTAHCFRRSGRSYRTSCTFSPSRKVRRPLLRGALGEDAKHWLKI